MARTRRRGLVALAVVAVLGGLAAGGRWLLTQPYFRVQHVTFVGLRHESRAAALAASGLADHPSMVGLDTGAIVQRLEAFPWVESASVSEHWPNSVVVTVHEATAVAVAFTPSHALAYVSAAGRDLGPAPLAANLPTLTYTGTSSAWPFDGPARGAAAVAGQLPPAFSRQVRVVSEDAAGDVSLTLTTPVTFELGTPTDLHAKFVAVASVIAHATLTAGDVVDVSVPDELAVTPPSGK